MDTHFLKVIPNQFIRKDIITPSISWVAALFLYFAYHSWGVSLIDDIYYERSLPFLNEILGGRDIHPLEYYYRRGNNVISSLVLLLCLVPFANKFFVWLYQKDNNAFRLIAPIFLIDLILSVVYVVSFGLPLGEFLTRFVNLNAEANLTTWYSSMKLFLVGLLFFLLAQKFSKNEGNEAWVLLILALTFFALSLDEVAQIHEHLGAASDKLLPGGYRGNTVFRITGIWMFLIAIPFLIFMLYMLNLLKRCINSPKIIKKYLVGLVVFLGSAGGIEILSNFTHAGNEVLQVWAEECGEMLGVTIMLWATYDLLVYHGVHIATTGRKT